MSEEPPKDPAVAPSFAPSEEPAAPPAEAPAPMKLTPWVTIALAAANVAVWLLTVALGASVTSPSPQQLFEYGGNLGAATLDGEEWRLFTSMFLHYGLMHVAMNMYGLYSGGRL